MDIKKVIRTLGLLKRANCQDYVRISELAKELKASKTELMAFVDDNQYLFVVGEPDMRTLKGKNPGLLVFDAFEAPDRNYIRPEFLARIKEENRNTVYVSEYRILDKVYGWYVAEDAETTGTRFPYDYDYRHKRHLWRNTAEKMRRLDATGHVHEGYFDDYGGGQTRFDRVLRGADMKALVAEGWTLEGELPNF